MNKITILEFPVNTIIGKDALNLGAGTIVKVIAHTDHPHSDVGDYLMRTTCSSKHPFVSLTTGTLYGMSIERYTFEVIRHDCKIITK